jgi:CHAD domain-containing protein
MVGLMQRSDELVSSLDKLWKEFSGAWKKARAKASEKSIHHLRVSSRRLIATLELTAALSKDEEIPRLQRRFKKVLKRMGPLRDVQVQLENVSKIHQAGVVAEFKQNLQRREPREIDRVRKKLVKRSKKRLNDGVKEVRSEFVRMHAKLNGERIHRSLERALNVRRNEFVKARRRFRPTDDESLHGMRIALKKLRYAVEAAQPVLGPSLKERAREMQSLQKILGDTRDVELLRTELEKWASKRGKKIAVAGALDLLTEKRNDLMETISKSAAAFDEIASDAVFKPVVETTHAPEAIVKPAPVDAEESPKLN